MRDPIVVDGGRPMSLPARIALLLRRKWRARPFGVTFAGTTTFRVPATFLIDGRARPFSLPQGETGPSLDFINLALDDEYGLGDLPFAPATVIDIGANCGLFSMLARKYCPAAVIHAYEPNPRVHPHATANLEPMGVKVFTEGVGSRAARATMDDTTESRMGRTVAGDDGTISIISLSEAIDRVGGTVDLLKLDCEGAEWDIFKDRDAFRRVRIIRMEYHLDGHSLEEFKSVVAGLNFRIDRLVLNRGYGMAWLTRIEILI